MVNSFVKQDIEKIENILTNNISNTFPFKKSKVIYNGLNDTYEIIKSSVPSISQKELSLRINDINVDNLDDEISYIHLLIALTESNNSSTISSNEMFDYIVESPDILICLFKFLDFDYSLQKTPYNGNLFFYEKWENWVEKNKNSNKLIIIRENNKTSQTFDIILHNIFFLIKNNRDFNIELVLNKTPLNSFPKSTRPSIKKIGILDKISYKILSSILSGIYDIFRKLDKNGKLIKNENNIICKRKNFVCELKKINNIFYPTLVYLLESLNASLIYLNPFLKTEQKTVTNAKLEPIRNYYSSNIKKDILDLNKLCNKTEIIQTGGDMYIKKLRNLVEIRKKISSFPDEKCVNKLLEDKLDSRNFDKIIQLMFIHNKN
jgi:hypothetical protein